MISLRLDLDTGYLFVLCPDICDIVLTYIKIDVQEPAYGLAFEEGDLYVGTFKEKGSTKVLDVYVGYNKIAKCVTLVTGKDVDDLISAKISTIKC